MRLRRISVPLNVCIDREKSMEHIENTWPSSTSRQKLAILADAAKYDASCASSGTTQARQPRRQGHRLDRGHGHLPRLCAGRALHLAAQDPADQQLHFRLRIIASTARARTSAARASRPRRSSSLTLAFYKRNYIEGLFLSSGIIRSSNYTMEQIVEVARSLREDHDFRGYIHLKTIPDADPELVRQAGLHADRVSINVELPTDDGPAPARAGKGRRADRGRDARHEAVDRRRRRTRREALQVGAEVRAGRPVDADDRRRGRRHRRRHRRPRQPRSTTASACAASIIRPSARSRTRAPCCRSSARR